MVKYFVVLEKRDVFTRDKLNSASFKIGFNGVDEDGMTYYVVTNAPETMTRKQFSMESGISQNRIRVYKKLNLSFVK